MIARLQGFPLRSLVIFSAIALTPLQLHAAESTQNGEWFCERSETDGRWACHRDGSTNSSSPQSAPSAPIDNDVVEEVEEVAQAAPLPREEAPEEIREVVREEVREEVTEEVAALPVADVAPPPVQQREEAPAPAPAYDPVQTGDYDDRPDYQRLAYVPDEPTSLLQLPGNFWVAQLMAVSSKEFLEEYATEHKLRGLSAARVASGERLFYILILGIYENKSLAQQAIADLPPPYDKYNPFLRSLKSLQQAMKRADDIAGSAEF